MVDKEEHAILVLKHIGEDDWSRPVYQDQYNKLWKDINLGYSWPSLCSVVNNEFDGEPDMPIKSEIKCTFSPAEGLINKEKKFQYMMLGRLRSDCDYYLGYGNRNPGHLYENNEKEHIEAIKTIWHSFSSSEKPEWLTWEQIIKYEEEMLSN